MLVKNLLTLEICVKPNVGPSSSQRYLLLSNGLQMKTTAFLGVFLSWPAWTKIPPSATLDLQLVTTPKDHEVCKLFIENLCHLELRWRQEDSLGSLTSLAKLESFWSIRDVSKKQ